MIRDSEVWDRAGKRTDLGFCFSQILMFIFLFNMEQSHRFTINHVRSSKVHGQRNSFQLVVFIEVVGRTVGGLKQKITQNMIGQI